MTGIKEAMLAVFQDVVYTQLHPKVKHQFEEAIKQFEVLESTQQIIRTLATEKLKEVNAAQTARFINFKQPPARFLSREIDRYPKCSNT